MFFCSNERLHHVQYDRQLLSNVHMISHEKPQLSFIAKQLFCGLCIQPCIRPKSEIPKHETAGRMLFRLFSGDV